MNIAQLIEAASDYGDHLPVVVVLDDGTHATVTALVPVTTGDSHEAGAGIETA